MFFFPFLKSALDLTLTLTLKCIYSKNVASKQTWKWNNGNKHNIPFLSKQSCNLKGLNRTTIVNMFASFKVNCICIYHVWPSGADSNTVYYVISMSEHVHSWFFFPDCQRNGLWKLICQLLRALILPLPLSPSHASNCITSSFSALSRVESAGELLTQ